MATQAAASTATAAARPIVLSGPSGAGKSTILKSFMDKHGAQFGFSTSHTTRAPRPGEVDGQHYHFVARPAFESLVAAGGFVEHAQFGANLYGTSYAAVAALQDAGRTPLLDIEIQGVRNVRAHRDWAARTRFVFLSPPSPEALEARLRGRGDTSAEDIEKRLAQAKIDMELAKEPGLFDKVIVNDDLEKAKKEFEDWAMEG